MLKKNYVIKIQVKPYLIPDLPSSFWFWDSRRLISTFRLTIYVFQNHIIYVLKSILRSDINKWTYKYKKLTCFVTRTIPFPLIRFRKGGGSRKYTPLDYYLAAARSAFSLWADSVWSLWKLFKARVKSSWSLSFCIFSRGSKPCKK